MQRYSKIKNKKHNQKKVIPTSDKVDFKTRNRPKDKERHFKI